MTRSITLLPVAISILLIFGVAHMYWLIFASGLVIGILFPESWLVDGSTKSYLFGFILAPILSLPLANFIENLRPKRTLVYSLSALAPATVFYGYLLLQQEGSSGDSLYVMLGVAPIYLGLPVAIFLLRQVRHKGAPNDTLQ